MGIDHCRNDPCDLGINQRLRARRRSAVKRTGLQTNVYRRTRDRLARVCQGVDLSVSLAGANVITAAKNPTVAHHKASHTRVWGSGIGAAGRELNGSLQEQAIRL